MEHRLSFSLYLAFKKVQMEYQRLADQIGLDSAPLAALRELWQQNGLTVTELGEKLVLKASTITSLVDRMERDGLVYRERGNDDRRVVKIYLTEQALKLQGRCPDFDEYLEQKLKPNFSDAEIKTLVKLLNKLESTL
ncbi:regulatory protein MarR [Desulfotomaculum nigrificans CO-1-SRB]|uniref:Regulatory protein MarR n=1 Tax=Desulfotomaculum nigrificans (strain DSM 14880 / VKM B-2319 / CO-1-SRB) TaxID=868595 RepID=F6B6R0_DESCC|nr:MarR family transcriptional regulator [Desulfotomaculum nigrificans]AEF95541.1 regulatory protein MarR [Desulfotomaculum nigrificans CO-1-SRB]